MERLSNNTTEAIRRADRCLEDLGCKIAKYNTPENRKFMQTEIEAAISALAHLFSVKDEELEHMVMPEFTFCFVDDYSPELNEISMKPEGITPYRISSLVEEFLYYKVNPEIFHQRHKVCLAYIRSSGKSKSLPSSERDYALGNAYINLTTMVSHYCGLFFCQNGCSESDHSSDLLEPLNSLPEDSDEYPWAQIGFGAHYRGMVMAECLFSRYPTEKFKPIVRLSFEEARARLFHMTGIELFDI